MSWATKKQGSKEWIWPPADQWLMVWGMVVFAVVGVIFTQLLSLFSHLSGLASLWCYAIALFFGAIGVCLLLTPSSQFIVSTGFSPSAPVRCLKRGAHFIDGAIAAQRSASPRLHGYSSAVP